MTIRQRAIQAEDKQERFDAILDAAERLLGHAPDRLASMAEVAEEAGVAKGTVYLYFRGKEDLYLALHERHLAAFFDEVIARAEAPAALAMEDVLGLIRRHMVEPPVFLPLAGSCFGAIPHSAPADAGHAFMERIALRLARAGRALESQFRHLAPGGGVALLRHSYAMVLGLWHMSTGGCASAGARPTIRDDARYAEELGQALAALWRGTLEPDGAPTMGRDARAGERGTHGNAWRGR